MRFTAAAVSEELTCAIKELARTSPEPSVKGRLRAVAQHVGLPYSRVADYWYGEVRCPPAHEADQIRAYYQAAQELIEAQRAYEEMRKRFLDRHPVLGRLAPRRVARGALLAEAEAAAESELAPKHRS